MTSGPTWDRILAGGTLLLLMAVGACLAQEKVTPKPDASIKDGAAKTEEETRSGEPHEGIQIHGHWTVTVHNPDGSVVSHREFENSLTQQGKSIVLSQLGDGASFMIDGPPSWELYVTGSLCTQHPGLNLGDCRIPVGKVSPSLTHPGEALIIGGTVRMDGTGQIMSVATRITNIGRNKGQPANPITFSSRDLTQPDSASAQAPAPITVQAGQNVDFSVSLTVP